MFSDVKLTIKLFLTNVGQDDTDDGSHIEFHELVTEEESEAGVEWMYMTQFVAEKPQVPIRMKRGGGLASEEGGLPCPEAQLTGGDNQSTLDKAQEIRGYREQQQTSEIRSLMKMTT